MILCTLLLPHFNVPSTWLKEVCIPLFIKGETTIIAMVLVAFVTTMVMLERITLEAIVVESVAMTTGSLAKVGGFVVICDGCRCSDIVFGESDKVVVALIALLVITESGSRRGEVASGN